MLTFNFICDIINYKLKGGGNMKFTKLVEQMIKSSQPSKIILNADASDKAIETAKKIYPNAIIERKNKIGKLTELINKKECLQTLLDILDDSFIISLEFTEDNIWFPNELNNSFENVVREWAKSNIEKLEEEIMELTENK